MAVALAVAIGLFASAWRYSTDILRHPLQFSGDEHITVTDVDPGSVTLPRGPASRRPGVWGLQWSDGYAQMREIVHADEDTVTRRRVDLLGDVQAGQRVRLDPHGYPPDPGDAFVFTSTPVRLEGTGVNAPAYLTAPEVTAADEERTRWRLAGPRDTWVVLAHGRGSHSGEALRLLPTIRHVGMPALLVSHRDDPDAAPRADGRYHLDAAGWQDIAAATDYALANGAEQVVLVGLSMGGASVAHYLHTGADADRVAGAVLDAPMLDGHATLRQAARDRGVPSLLAPVSRWLTMRRTGGPWAGVDEIARADALRTPILLVHGSADPIVPVEVSDAFAAARPDLVTYLRVDGAGHLRAWNHDPGLYEQRLRDFLLDVAD